MGQAVQEGPVFKSLVSVISKSPHSANKWIYSKESGHELLALQGFESEDDIMDWDSMEQDAIARQTEADDNPEPEADADYA